MRRDIEALASATIDDRLSDEALAALTNGWTAVYNMVSCSSLDDEYGDRRRMAGRLDRLAEIAFGRCEGSAESRARLIPTLNTAVFGSDRPSDDDRVRRYDLCASMLLNEWFDGGCREEEPAVEYAAMLSLADLYGATAVDGECDDEDFRLFAGRIAQWRTAWSDDEGWVDVSDFGALCRLDILCRSSHIVGSGDDEHLLAAILDRCFRRMEERLSQPTPCTAEECRMAGMLCRLLLGGGFGAPQYGRAERVAEAARRMAETNAANDDCRMLLTAAVVEVLCMKTSVEVRNRSFSNIA